MRSFLRINCAIIRFDRSDNSKRRKWFQRRKDFRYDDTFSKDCSPANFSESVHSKVTITINYEKQLSRIITKEIVIENNTYLIIVNYN